MTCDGLHGGDMLAAVPGLTYRRLYMWTRAGLIHAHRHIGGHREATRVPGVGRYRQGVPLCWDPSEVPVALDMMALVDAGVSPAVAARLARSEAATIDVDGIVLTYRRA